MHFYNTFEFKTSYLELCQCFSNVLSTRKHKRKTEIHEHCTLCVCMYIIHMNRLWPKSSRWLVPVSRPSALKSVLIVILSLLFFLNMYTCKLDHGIIHYEHTQKRAFCITYCVFVYISLDIWAILLAVHIFIYHQYSNRIICHIRSL